MLKIHTLRALKDNFTYVLEGEGVCACLDPGESVPVLAFLKARPDLKLTHILCTHHHADHIAGIPELISARTGIGIEVVTSAYDRARIPQSTLAVDERTPLDLWGRRVSVLEVPGHTLGQIAYWFEPEKALFVGDTLFSAGCGRLFEGTGEQMFTSLQKIKCLPLDTRIYVGHEYTVNNLKFVLSKRPDDPKILNQLKDAQDRRARDLDTTPTSLATELKINPFLIAGSVDEFRRWRDWRDHW